MTMELFRPRPRVDGARARIRGWVAELGLDRDDAVVMIQELRCDEPGCPPVETVIAVLALGPGAQTRKIHRAAADVTREDVARAFGREPSHMEVAR